MNDLRIEFRTRNNVLWHAIFDHHKNVAEFCRTYGLDKSAVGEYLNLSRQPRRYVKNKHGYERTEEVVPTAKRLCEITGYGADMLFPPDLYSGVLPRNGVAEVQSARYVGLAAARSLALPPSQEEEFDKQELRSAALAVAMNALNQRERLVIQQRFGLGDSEEHSLDDVAGQLGVTRERVRQIEAKAMRKLRHPKLSRKLKPYLEMK